MELSKKIRLDIFNSLKNKPGVFESTSDYGGVIDLLNDIWELKLLPSEDERFDDAEGDAIQHLVNNDDWDYDYTFIERFDLLNDQSAYGRFLEAVVSPIHRKDTSEIIHYVDEINELLIKESVALVVEEYDDLERPIYKLKTRTESNSELPEGLVANKIKFYTTYDKGKESQIKDDKAFILKFNHGWNDYSYQSIFHLSFLSREDTNSPHYLGSVKIISSSDENIVDSVDDPDYVMTQLPETFYKLDSTYCSLGQSIDYYEKLKELLGPYFESVLHAFRDAAFDTDIQDEFENVIGFKSSLIRYDDAERVMREAKLEMEGSNRSDLYKFAYRFKPQYAETPVTINFEFNDDLDIPNRVCALIGKNGVGKTQIMTSLPLNISNRANELFEPRVPIFSKVIAVSYSAFDSFQPPKKTKNLNYVFCGIRDENGGIINERSKASKFVHIRKRIESLSRIQEWRRVLYIFMDKEVVDQFIVESSNSILASQDRFSINVGKLNEVKRKLSSGESILFHSVADIIAHIRYDSLLLFDEPETHLHPNAISSLMNMIYEVVNEFKSFCIVATHSPLIIRELLSRNVFVVEREANNVSVRKIGIECFGENLTVLTEEVFGNREIPKQYKAIIRGLLERGLSVDQIVESIESDDRPISLNARIYIESLASVSND